MPGAERRADDFYETPAWCVRAFLRGCKLPGGLWLEPTAGSGAIVRAVEMERRDIVWHLCEKRPEAADALRTASIWSGPVQIGDYLSTTFKETHDVCIGNPPFSLALEVIRHAMTMSRVVAMLLRINFLASQKRAAWMCEHTPSVYVYGAMQV